MPEIRYNFSESGADRVEQQFASIAKRAKEAQRATTARARASQRAAKEEYQGYTSTHKRTMAAAVKRQRDEKRLADKAARDHERALAKRERQENRLHARMAKARQRAMDKEVRDTQRAQDKIQRARSKRVAGAIGGAASFGLRAVGAIGAAGMAVGGLAARQSLQLNDLATKISVQGRDVGGQAMSARGLREGFEAAAAGVPGASATGVAEGVSEFITKTGDMKTALAIQNDLATVMVATGSEGRALGQTMADLAQKFDIKSVGGMRDAMASLIAQGKKGSFELEDAAKNFAKIGAAAERFGGMRGAEGLKTLGGLTQIARSSVGSGERAGTAVEAMFRQVVAKSDVIKRGAKVDVFKDKNKTQTRGIQDILVETIAGMKGNQQKLQSVFGEEGIRAISPLISRFNEVTTETGNASAGMAAMRKMLDEAINAGGNWADVQKDAAIMGKTSAATFTAVWEQFKQAFGAQATPAITKAIASFMALDKETGLITSAAKGLGTVFTAIAEAGEMTADVLKAIGVLKPKDENASAHLRATQQAKQAERAMAALGLDRGEQDMAADIHKRYGGASTEEQLVAAQAAGLSSEKYLEYSRIRGDQDAAASVLWKDAESVSPEKARAQFIKRYAAAGGGGPDAKRKARLAANEMEKGPGAFMAELEQAKKLGETPIVGGLIAPGGRLEGAQNPQQMAALQEFAAEVTAQKAAVKESGLPDALKEAATAAKNFAANANGGTPSGANVFAGG